MYINFSDDILKTKETSNETGLYSLQAFPFIQVQDDEVTMSPHWYQEDNSDITAWNFSNSKGVFYLSNQLSNFSNNWGMQRSRTEFQKFHGLILPNCCYSPQGFG